MLTNGPSDRGVEIELLKADRTSNYVLFVLNSDQPRRHELLEVRNIEDHRLSLGFCVSAVDLSLLAVHHHDEHNGDENEQSSCNIP